MKRTPEWYDAYQKRVDGWKAKTAAQWNGNIEPVSIAAAPVIARRAPKAAATPSIAGAAIRKDAEGTYASLGGTPATSKFRNVKTNGCASKKESERAFALKLMQKAGHIRNLCEQTQYELIPRQEGERACFYRADFVYEEFGADGWRKVVEDTKGVRTTDYVIKRKLMLHVHGIRIRET